MYFEASLRVMVSGTILTVSPRALEIISRPSDLVSYKKNGFEVDLK